MEREETGAELQDWVPSGACWRENRLMIEWCHLGGRRFIEPFFRETISRCLSSPNNQLPCPEAPIEVLGELYEQQPGIEPSGLIFHMSRCGSTLLAQMLAALPQNIVLSEAEPLDAVLSAHLHHHLPWERQVEWVRWMVSALGQIRHDGERHLFLKMDSWHILHLPLIREAFPTVPWIFLYRDPIEVMVSHQRHPGSQMMPGAKSHSLLGIDAIDACLIAPEEYSARVLAAICQAALDAYDPVQCLLVNYSELPQAAWQMLPRHFRVDCTIADAEAMRRVTAFDAKQPTQQFQDDRSQKQQAATVALRQQAARWGEPIYNHLEELRVKRIGVVE